MIAYASTDASSPGNVSNMMQAVPYAVLCTGYGAKAAAGWSRVAHVDSTYSVFKMGGGSQNCLLMNWSASSGYIMAYGGNAVASDGSLLNRFPTTAQQNSNAGVVYCYNPNTTGPWRIWADSKFMIMRMQRSASETCIFLFGDYIPFRETDTQCCMISGSNYPTIAFDNVKYSLPLGYTLQANVSISFHSYGTYTLMSHTNQMVSTPCGLMSEINAFMDQTYNVITSSVNNIANITGYNNAMASNTDLGVNDRIISRVMIHSGGVPRGYVPGLWHVACTGSWTDNEVVVGTGAHAGRTFMACVTGTAPTQTTFLIETSDTWYV